MKALIFNHLKKNGLGSTQEKNIVHIVLNLQNSLGLNIFSVNTSLVALGALAHRLQKVATEEKMGGKTKGEKREKRKEDKLN